MLLQNAYSIREDLISGGPGWVDSTHFDINAKVAAGDVAAYAKLKGPERREMMKQFLAERFQLKVHTETKTLPVYELQLAKGGAKLTDADPANTYPNGIKGEDGVAHPGMMRMQRGELTAQTVPIATLVNQLSYQLHRTVLDKTGLPGNYDIHLTWTPEEEGGPGPDPQHPGASNADGPSIYTALQEQLGLRLQSTKGPVETLVIDHVELPSEN